MNLVYCGCSSLFLIQIINSFRASFELIHITDTSMASSVVIPLDIIVSAIDDHDHRSLKSCALVSSSFLLPCRKRLFSSISLRSERACQRLHQFLVENPVIQADGRFRVQKSHSSLISDLRLFYCLKSFYMWHASNWNDFSSELKYALSTIIHTSTIKTPHFSKLVNIPTSLLQGTHLTKLTLWSISPLDLFDFKGNQPRLVLASSEGVPNTVIDHCEWGFCLAPNTSFSTPGYPR